MRNPLALLVHCSAGSNQYRIPVLFIHVKARPHEVVLLAQLFGQGGLTLQVEALEGLQVGEGEYLAAHLKYQRIRPKRRFLRGTGQAQAEIAEFLDIHRPGFSG